MLQIHLEREGVGLIGQSLARSASDYSKCSSQVPPFQVCGLVASCATSNIELHAMNVRDNDFESYS